MTPSGSVVLDIAARLQEILNKKHVCQQDLGDDEEDDIPSESSEYDWLVIETAMDTVTCLAASLGSSFGELWPKFQQPIYQYCSSQEHNERSAAVGTIADCIGNMQDTVGPYTSKLFTILKHRLSDEDVQTKSNTVYAIGLLCEKSPDEKEVLRHYAPLLAQLEQLLNSQQDARLRDNVAGCVSRLMWRHPTHVPIEQVLPRLVEILPLTEDFDENEPVYRLILQLCKF